MLLMGFTGFVENFFLYHPVRKIDVTPADHGVPFQDVRFQARDERPPARLVRGTPRSGPPRSALGARATRATYPTGLRTSP